MLLKNKGPNVHVHAKYQTWIWFQKYINPNGTWSYHITSCFWMKYASPDHHEINGINLSENKSTFLYQTETKEEKNKYQRAERQKTSIRRAEQTVCGWASSRMFSIVLYCRCHFPFYIPAKNNAHQSMHYLHI